MHTDKNRYGQKTIKTRDLTYIAFCVVLMAICAWMTIPVGIPLTMQVFAVAFTAAFLGGKRGLIAVIVYILMGAIGLPVFSGMNGGFGVLLGNTGGYIIGYIFMVLVMWLMEKLCPKLKNRILISMILGLCVCYIFGTAWFIVVYTKNTAAVGIGAALAWCVWPYVIPDIAKLVLANLMCKRLKKWAI